MDTREEILKRDFSDEFVNKMKVEADDENGKEKVAC